MQTSLRHTGILRLTPVASRRAHLLAASLMWSLAGLGLSIAGVIWMAQAGSHWFVPVALVAIAAGALKARLVLDQTAGTIVERIRERGDGRCLGGFLSWKGWSIVAAMMILGRLLRMSPLPLLPRGAIYLAIGAALLVASRVVWGAFQTAIPTPPSSGSGSPRS